MYNSNEPLKKSTNFNKTFQTGKQKAPKDVINLR